jgi:hypothetical protein
VAQAIHAAAVLGVADALDEQPRPTATLAAQLDVDASALRRLLRGLAALELVAAHDGDAWTITALGRPLRADAPGSLRSYAMLHGRQLWPAWARLADCGRSGRATGARGAGVAPFDALAGDAGAASVFGEAMHGRTSGVVDEIVAAMALDGVATLVYVGGGHGELLAAALGAHPGLRGVLVERAHVVDAARDRLRRAGVDARCELVAVDGFATPPAADAVVMKSVLHDWNDEQATALLAACRAGLTGGARLFVVERLLPETVGSGALDRELAASDLTMLVATSGRERTAAEIAALLRAGGFAPVRTMPAGEYTVVEATAC